MRGPGRGNMEIPFRIPSAIIHGEEELLLITDSVAYCQALLKQQFSDKVISISPRALRRKKGRDLLKLLCQVTAVLVDGSNCSTNLLTILRKNRVHDKIPILVLCGEQEAEQVAALIMGADGTLSRQFNPILLEAKLVAYRRAVEGKRFEENPVNRVHKHSIVIRDEALNKDNRNMISVGSLCMNRSARVFYVNHQPVQLTPMEFDLMEML